MTDNDSQKAPAHSHPTAAECRPDRCTAHPAWATIGATDPADVIAGHLPDAETRAPQVWQEGGYVPPRVVDVGALEDRVTALERWRDDQVSDNRDEPCETGPEEGTSTPPTVGEFLAEARRDRRNRADAMLGTAETVRATGGAAEIGGIRMERCDTYGRTETTERLERVRHRLGILEREASQLKDERDVALAGAESAERDADTVAATLACGARTVHEGVWRDCERSVGHPGHHVATSLGRVEW